MKFEKKNNTFKEYKSRTNHFLNWTLVAINEIEMLLLTFLPFWSPEKSLLLVLEASLSFEAPPRFQHLCLFVLLENWDLVLLVLQQRCFLRLRDKKEICLFFKLWIIELILDQMNIRVRSICLPVNIIWYLSSLDFNSIFSISRSRILASRFANNTAIFSWVVPIVKGRETLSVKSLRIWSKFDSLKW